LCQNLELVWHDFFDARSEIILDSFWILARFFFHCVSRVPDGTSYVQGTRKRDEQDAASAAVGAEVRGKSNMAHNLNNISATALKMARKEGAKNYRRSLVKELVAEFLPNGNLLWKAVADEYKRRSGEKDDRDPREMEKYWRFKMCNNFKKPRGGGGPHKDFILECISIQRKIIGKSSATVLGGSSGDEGYYGMMNSTMEDEKDDDDDSLEGVGVGGYAGSINSDEGGDDDVADEGDGEGDPPSLFTAAPDENNAVALQRPAPLHSPRPESASPLVGGDGFHRLTFGNDPLTPTSTSGKKRMSCSSSNHSSSKTKNSTNKKRHSVSQSIDMLVQSIDNAPTVASAALAPATSDGSSLFLSVQMLQQQQSMQMQLFCQEQKFESEQISTRMNSLEESTSTTTKLLQKILKNQRKAKKKKKHKSKKRMRKANRLSSNRNSSSSNCSTSSSNSSSSSSSEDDNEHARKQQGGGKSDS
jgi:hypothetical protein